MQPIDVTELAFGEKASLCWSFFWRGIAVTFGSMFAGALLGGLAGMLVGLVGGRPGAGTALMGVAVGFACGCVFLFLYIRWLLSARLGKFRLMLVAA